MKEIAKKIRAGLENTATFLEFLNNIGKYTYRKNVKLSDVELENFINEQKTNITLSIRDYLVFYEFIKKENLQDKLMIFQTELQKEFEKPEPLDLIKPW